MEIKRLGDLLTETLKNPKILMKYIRNMAYLFIVVMQKIWQPFFKSSWTSYLEIFTRGNKATIFTKCIQKLHKKLMWPKEQMLIMSEISCIHNSRHESLT